MILRTAAEYNCESSECESSETGVLLIPHSPVMPDTPEDKARKTIDDLLSKAGWTIQDRDMTNLSAARGVAIRVLAVQQKTQAGVPVPPKPKHKEGIAPDMANLPKLPEGWTWATIDQLTSLITTGSRGWAGYYSDSGPLLIRAQDIKTDRLELGSVAHVRLPARIEGASTLVSRGDLLITITGANVTKTAIVREYPGESYVSQHVALVRPVDSSL